MRGVGEQGQRAGEQARHDLDDHEAEDQPEREPQLAAVGVRARCAWSWPWPWSMATELGYARMRAVIAVMASTVLLAGCGGGATAQGDAPKRSGRLVDFSQKPPYVNALDIDPATGDFLLTTNRGFFRIDAKHEGGRARARHGHREHAVGRRRHVPRHPLDRAGRLLGSGHPDIKGQLPPYLGLIASDDGGQSWRSVSKLGEADFHKIVIKHGRLYAFDAVLGAMLISSDGGRRFVERFTPPGLIIDFEVDPGDGDHLLAATDARLVRSTDGGKRWRPIDDGRGDPARVAGAGRALPRGEGRHRPALARRRRALGAGRQGARASRTSSRRSAPSGSTSRSATARSSARRTAAATGRTTFRP